MATAKSGILGLHNIAIVNPTTKELVGDGLLKVADSATIDLGETVVTLKGGDSNYPYAAAIVDANSNISVPVKEFPTNFMALLSHSTATTAAAETTGTPGTAVNVTGTSVVAATGIDAAATATVGGTLKEGIYIIKAASATTVNIYAYTDFSCLALQSDLTGLVNATPYTITTSTAVAITEIGISLTGSAGTIGMTENDTAIITVRKINTGTHDISITDCINNSYYKVYMFFQPTTSGDMDYIELYRALISKGSYSAAIRDFHSQEINITPTKDPANSNYIGKWHRTLG